jgi:diguanylate cyclase (GGDEF)-like protein
MLLEPLTAYLVTTAYVLLNGAVLGFMHRVLPTDLQPSAADWRVGTLLFAGSTILFVGYGATKVEWVLPIANALLLCGMALYLRSLRRYHGRTDSWWLFAPIPFDVALLAYFTLVDPNLGLRVVISSLFGLGYMVASIVLLMKHRRDNRSASSVVLIVLMSVAAILLALRMFYYVFASSEVTAITQAGNLVNALSPILIASLPIAGTTAFALLCFERIRRDLHVVATTDALTGLPNRRTIAERANEMFAHSKLNRGTFSIGVIDVDHFKSVNDRYGHDVGDRVLTNVARVLSRNLREACVVGRQGGEEFVVLFDAADRQEAFAAVERLRAEIAHEQFLENGQRIDVTVSIGLATRESDDANTDDILRRADRALFRAKADGRNLVRQA